MSIFARASRVEVEVLPNWRDEEKVRAVQARVSELSERRTRLEAELKHGQRTNGLYEPLIVTPSPASPHWEKLRLFQETCAELKVAQHELAQTEANAKAETQRVAEEAIRSFIDRHVPPAIHPLKQLAEDWRELQRETLKAGLTLPGLAWLAVEVDAIDNYPDSLRKRVLGE
jgi:hypothetical protein